MHCTAAAALSLQVVDHLLLGNEVRGLVDQWHERVEFVWPVVEQVVGVFGPLEVDDACQPVHLGVDGLVDHQSGEELLRFLVWEESRSLWNRRTKKKKKSHTTGPWAFMNSSMSNWSVHKLLALTVSFTRQWGKWDEDAYVNREVEESGHPLHSDSGVILGHYSNVLQAQGQCHEHVYVLTVCRIKMLFQINMSRKKKHLNNVKNPRWIKMCLIKKNVVSFLFSNNKLAFLLIFFTCSTFQECANMQF